MTSDYELYETTTHCEGTCKNQLREQLNKCLKDIFLSKNMMGNSLLETSKELKHEIHSKISILIEALQDTEQKLFLEVDKQFSDQSSRMDKNFAELNFTASKIVNMSSLLSSGKCLCLEGITNIPVKNEMMEVVPDDNEKMQLQDMYSSDINIKKKCPATIMKQMLSKTVSLMKKKPCSKAHSMGSNESLESFEVIDVTRKFSQDDSVSVTSINSSQEEENTGIKYAPKFSLHENPTSLFIEQLKSFGMKSSPISQNDKISYGGHKSIDTNPLSLIKDQLKNFTHGLKENEFVDSPKGCLTGCDLDKLTTKKLFVGKSEDNLVDHSEGLNLQTVIQPSVALKSSFNHFLNNTSVDNWLRPYTYRY